MASVVAAPSTAHRSATGTPKPVLFTAVAQWDYKANESNELSFRQGDLIEVIENSNTDWWEGRINGVSGYFPSNHVEARTKTSVAARVSVAQQQELVARRPTTSSGEYTYESAGSKRISTLQDAETLPGSPQLLPTRNKISAVLEAKLAAGNIMLDPEHASGRESISSIVRQSSALARTTTKNSMVSPSNLQSITANSSTSSLYMGPKIESVPPEIIRKEGMITIKQRYEPGGMEPKKQLPWDKMYCVLCVGYFLLWKEDPAKAKKPARPALTIYLNTVQAEQVNKDITKKKNAIQLTTDDDSQYWIILSNESEINEWIEAFCDNSRERSTKAEYENATNRLFPSAEDQAKSNLERANTVTSPTNAGRESTASGASLFRRGTTTKSSFSDDPDKKNKMKNKLSAFLFKRPTVETLKEKGIIREDALVFGGLLTVDLDEELGIPTIVRQCIEEVERRGVDSQGIYRLSGNASMIQKLKTSVNQGEAYDITDDDYGSDVVASLLKLYFRELQNPLIPYEAYGEFIAAAKIENPDAKSAEIRRLVQGLPKANFDTLSYLVKHLLKVAAKSDVNKMEPSNLAIVFGPTLIRMPDEGQSGYVNMMNMTYNNSLVEFMISRASNIFSF